ncbi:MAG: (Fe-S)-binding protein [Bacteroidetes bacterium]|nr:(Fe-S)-binding protein [Bacteroidota bacterium]
MTFNIFVLPFSLGFIFLLLTIFFRYRKWIKALEKEDRIRFSRGLHSRKFFLSLKEILFESLLHRKMFRKNPLLGYMHMTFAFGWFLLIILGNLESRIYSGWWINPPYYPIFMKFFIHDKHVLPFEIFTVPGFFRFSMDLVLVVILSGLVLAIIKRRRSRWFGIQRTTRLQLTDKVAMTCLWLIFPLRFLAESFTSGAYGYGGGFVTQHFGNLLAILYPFSDKSIAYGFWWFYSLSLGIFFVTLPYSRYMHIPTELLLILFRNFGIKHVKSFSAYADVEVFSCSRCGVCIDVCQLATANSILNIQSVYFIQSIRDRDVRADITMKCLLCGRCTDTCPVGINTDSLRLIERRNFAINQLPVQDYIPVSIREKAEIIYFAGCMTHLTPGIIKSMITIFKTADVDFLFLDEEKTICCGRPLMITGQEDQAAKMIGMNNHLIKTSGAKLLVTSCPICYRIFREEYKLDIEVLHHSQYILQLIRKGKIPLQAYFRNVVYHDPCELGRGSGVYMEPREVLEKVADVRSIINEKNRSLCCGGSLGILNIDRHQRDAIIHETLKTLMSGNPEMIATACPLCKKTLSKHSSVMVRDIAEIVCQAIPGTKYNPVAQLTKVI